MSLVLLYSKLAGKTGNSLFLRHHFFMNSNSVSSHEWRINSVSPTVDAKKPTKLDQDWFAFMFHNLSLVFV